MLNLSIEAYLHHKPLVSEFIDAKQMNNCLLIQICRRHPDVWSHLVLYGTYIHPHHGHMKVNDMLMNGRLTSLSHHVNRPSYFLANAISNFNLETSS